MIQELLIQHTLVLSQNFSYLILLLLEMKLENHFIELNQKKVALVLESNMRTEILGIDLVLREDTFQFHQ